MKPTDDMLKMQQMITMFECMGCWGMAESLRRILFGMIEAHKTEQQQ